MKTLGVLVSQYSRFVCIAATASFLGMSSTVRAFDDVPTVNYLPAEKLVEGDAPVNTSYVLSITSPSSVASGQSVTISPVLTVVSGPLGANLTQAVTYVSLSPSTLVFTGPGMTLTTTVTSSVPIGAIAGAYKYSISTPGWPAGTVDNFAYINMTLTMPQVPVPPSVVLRSPADGSVWTYNVGGPALSIPVQIESTAPSYAPIDFVGGDASGTSFTSGLSSTGMNTGDVVSTGVMTVSNSALPSGAQPTISAPGIYTITATAHNVNGNSTTSAEITVNFAAPPPTVSIATPAANSSYTYTPGGAALSVPFSFSAVSAYGVINALSATLTSGTITTPVILTTITGIGNLNASAGGTLLITAAGSYVLTVSGTDQNGTATATRSFTVTVVSQTPPPTVTITTPANGSSFTRKSTDGPLCIPFSFTALAGSGATISSISASLNNTAVTVTATGVGSNSAKGTGSLSITTAGTYTLTAKAVSGGTTAVAQTTFTVVVTSPPPPVCKLVWLPPLSQGKLQCGGTTIPIKFEINCGTSGGGCNGNNNTLRDTSVQILVSEIYSNGTASCPQSFSYGCGWGWCWGWGSATYSIDCNNNYELDFNTARGTHTYHVEVYRFPDGVTAQLVGTKEFKTH